LENLPLLQLTPAAFAAGVVDSTGGATYLRISLQMFGKIPYGPNFIFFGLEEDVS
jgi:hypothetical protein